MECHLQQWKLAQVLRNTRRRPACLILIWRVMWRLTWTPKTFACPGMMTFSPKLLEKHGSLSTGHGGSSALAGGSIPIGYKLSSRSVHLGQVSVWGATVEAAGLHSPACGDVTAKQLFVTTVREASSPGICSALKGTSCTDWHACHCWAFHWPLLSENSIFVEIFITLAAKQSNGESTDNINRCSVCSLYSFKRGFERT